MSILPFLLMASAGIVYVPEILRPDSEVAKSNMASGSYADFDETSSDDASTQIVTNTLSSGQSASYTCGLTNPAAPVGPGPHTVRFRAMGTGAQRNLTCHVYEGETLRASSSTITPGTSYTTYTFQPDLSAVTNFNDLRLQFVFQRGDGPSSNYVGYLSWAELELNSE